MDRLQSRNSGLKVLALEDSVFDMELISERIKAAGYSLELTHVLNETDYLTALHENRYDIIISDYNLPGYDAFSALDASLEICPETPFICVSGSIGEEKAIELLKRGAVDYVLKDRPERLPFAVKRALDEAMVKESGRQATRELLESEEKFRNMFQNHSAIKLIVDPENGKIIEANKAAARFYGWSVMELKQMTVYQINTLQHDELTGIIETILKKKKIHLEFTHRKADGSEIDVEVFSSKIKIAGKEYLHSIIHDITEKKKALRELIAAKEKAEESNKLKTAFLMNMTHEIRTPLNGILGFMDLLKETSLDEDSRNDYIELINQSAGRLVKTMNDIIEMSKIQSGAYELEPVKVELQEFMAERFEYCIKQKRNQNLDIRLMVEPEVSGKNITADKFKLESVVNKLIDNAYKFTSTGFIELGCRTSLNNSVIIHIKDTGEGIPAERLHAIFDVFVQADLSLTRNHEGAGLGLSIVKAYVELMGGKIFVESETGIGSTFFIEFPLETEPIATEEQNSPQYETDVPRIAKVLVAEDDETCVKYLNSVLSIYNLEVITARNGEEAIDLLKNNSDIAFILMDIKMPVMDGIEATKQIRLFDQNIPIIAQTAHAFTTDRDAALKSGCNEFLTKPVTRERLLDIIRKYSNL